MLKELLELARPRQWIKNLFCLGGLFFGGHLFAWPLVLKAAAVFAGFCALSSAAYVFNDIHDRGADRHHPRKRSRPLVAGSVSVRAAYLAAAVLLVAAFVFLRATGREFPAVAVAAGVYLGLNLAYTLALKKIPLIDVNVIALGFVMRVAAGAFGVSMTPTPWLLLWTFFLALFVAFGKRRAQLFEAGAEPREGRVALAGYDSKVLDAGLGVCAALVVLTYIFYCLFSAEHEGRLILLTSLPVAAGVLRFLGLARDGGRVAAPEAVLCRDWILGGSVLTWAVLCGYVIYGQAI
jgi:4-hydroxybenzoate polyprenyltransferase